MAKPCKHRTETILLLTWAALALCLPVRAAMVPRDLLGGIGGFEHSCYSSWVSSYGGADYDWAAPGRWAYGPAANGYRWGYNIATADDCVAERWQRESSLNPAKNLIYRLVDNAGGKCQYFAIRGVPTGRPAAYLQTSFDVGTEAYMLNEGDTITFTVDSIRMADYDGVNFTCRLVLDHVDGGSSEQDLPLSTESFSSSVAGKVMRGAKSVKAKVMIMASGGTGAHTPGIYIDNAHLTITRAGALLKEEVPAKIDRNIKTMKVFVKSTDDAYTTARDYDIVDLQYENDYWFARRLKYYNPNIKVYLYEGTWVCDWRERDYGNRDALWSNTPVSMGTVLAHDAQPGVADWLYPKGDSWVRGDHANAYYAHLGDRTFQQSWVANALGRVARYKLDGLFIDGPTIATASDGFPGIEPWEQQSLLHAVTAARTDGVGVINNSCSLNLIDGFDASATKSARLRWPETGRIFFDPTWKPASSGEYIAAKGYTANTPDNTVDGMYQESAFWGFGNGQNWYSQAYAENCLRDMDAVAKWNANLPANRKKRMHMEVRGLNRQSDMAYHIDGWLNFGLCCYLLGQNEWTTLGCRVDTLTPAQPFDDAKKLGEPAAPRVVTTGLGTRAYFGSDSGALGGIAVANMSDSDAVYTLTLDLIDQDGAFHPAGSTIRLSPHTGRLLFNQSNHKYASAVTSPADGATVTGKQVTIAGRAVTNRPGIALPAKVQVRIDSGPLIDCGVSADGTWQTTATVGPGNHSVQCQAGSEPAKHARTFSVKG